MLFLSLTFCNLFFSSKRGEVYLFHYFPYFKGGGGLKTQKKSLQKQGAGQSRQNKSFDASWNVNRNSGSLRKPNGILYAFFTTRLRPAGGKSSNKKSSLICTNQNK